ncbi:MAG TPA: sigma-70 family RNA polymerase sigma factor [candidate division Zixibacteria bacterium]|nr:sigma-70 family RNA polymerase sigma factor [candidate division Zixibacteria bacterium]
MDRSSLQNARDEELVALCQQGRAEVFEILVSRYMQKAFRIAMDFTRDVEDAKDLSQEAFLRAFSRIRQFDGRSSFYTWFYRLVVNLCLDYTRRRGRVIWQRLERETDEGPELKELVDTASSPDGEAIAVEARRRADETLKAMPKKQRTAFLLRNHQGLSIADIAKVLKTTEGTVRVYLHRAVAALRQSLLEFV